MQAKWVPMVVTSRVVVPKVTLQGFGECLVNVAEMIFAMFVKMRVLCANLCLPNWGFLKICCYNYNPFRTPINGFYKWVAHFVAVTLYTFHD